MRTFSLISLTLAAGLAAFAGNSHDATYAVGDLDGLSAGAKGFVRADPDALLFHSGKVTVEAPYTRITGTELGQKVSHAGEHKFAKVFGNSSERQSLMVNFKDASGKDQTMTLEVTDVVALELQNYLDFRTGVTARRQHAEGWWGDDIWKTNRNQSSWNTQTASAK